MPQIKIHGKSLEVDQEVYNILRQLRDERDANYAAANNLQIELHNLQNKIREWQWIEDVATKSKLKGDRIIAWQKKLEIYSIVPKTNLSNTLFK